jgi:exopolyphosphatase/guanosine-5'-triphosphate,3'-diphosphate pyrophosphatase
MLEDDRCALIMVFRLSVLMHRNRQDGNLPEMKLLWSRSNGFRLIIEPGWLAHNALTETALLAEVGYWKDVGISLMLE